ncbi:MAG: phosphodiester glycosidase family protein [Clostridia bacterium]|nr:phosphodiester glycosidase family protein [Clostridia bacterium]
MIKRNKKEPSKNLKLFWFLVRRTLITLLVILLFLLGSVYALGLTLANGPSPSLRDMLVLSAKQASATKWLPGLFLDDDTINEIMANSEKVTVTEIDINDFKPKPPEGTDIGGGEEYDEWADYPEGVRLEFLQGSTYRAYLTVVKDPSRVFVGVCDNMGTAPQGMTIFKIAQKYDAHVVINAGGFPDNGSSPGNIPLGITYSQNQCVWDDGIRLTFIGIDENNRLIVKEGMTREEADGLKIRDGVCFQNGNVLITNENGKVQLHYSEGNVGAAQRTAIGQRADGTMLLVVTDGRSAASIGASRNDIIDLLVSQGAVVAGMLDGGTSSLMYFDNYISRYHIDESALDQYQLQGIVNKYKAFIPPRTMPTYFVVAKDKGE